MFRNRVRNTVMLGVVILVAIAAAGWFLVLGPRFDEAATLADQRVQTEAASTQLAARYTKVVDQARQASGAAQDAQRLFASMPQQADLPTVLVQIIDAAKAAGIDGDDISVINTTVPAPVTGEGAAADGSGASASRAAGLGIQLATLNVDVTVNGPPAAVVAFLHNIQSLDRAVLVTATSLGEDLDSADGRPTNRKSLAVTTSMFVLQSKLPDLVAQVDALLADSGLPAAA